MPNATFDDAGSDPKQITMQSNTLHESISEDGTLKYDFMISLKNIALAKISTILCMNRRHKIAELFHKKYEAVYETLYVPGYVCLLRNMKIVLDNVKCRVRELHLPKSIGHKLRQVLRFTVKYMLEWIAYHDEYVFIPRDNSKCIAAQLIGYIAWNARGTIDDAQTAKNILADPECCLTDDHKYKLACSSCLEDEIAVMAPNVVGPDYLDGVDFATQPMVWLHTTSITGDSTKLHNHVDLIQEICPEYRRNMSAHCIAMQELLEHVLISEVAVRYVWNKLSEREKSENLTKVIKRVCEKGFTYSLLSNLECEQQRFVFRECYYPILKGMLNDWLLQEHFVPTALHVSNVTSPSNYCKIMQMLFKKMEVLSENAEDTDEENYSRCREINELKSMFKELWQGGSKYINVCLNSERERSDCAEWLRELVIFLLSSKHDVDLVQLVLDNFDAEEKKMMMFTASDLFNYSDIITNYEWDMYEQLIKCTLSSKEDIDLLKYRLLNEYKISEYLLRKNAWNKLDSFLKWALTCEAEIAKFKQRTAHVECLNLPENLMTENYFRDLENHLKWCANDDPEIIEQLKAEACKLDGRKALIVPLIKESKFELLNRILNFRFSNNQHRIAEFKSNIYMNPHFNCIFKSEPLSLKRDFSINKLDEFVDWCFTDAQEVQKFKKWMLRELKRENFLRPLIITKRFREAEEFINWCIDSTEEATTFKNMFMLSRDIEIILRDAHNHTQHELQSLVEWLNPSKETVVEFKKLFPDKKCPPTFFKLLDDFVCSQPAVGNEGEISVHDCNSNYLQDQDVRKKKLKKDDILDTEY